MTSLHTNGKRQQLWPDWGSWPARATWPTRHQASRAELIIRALLCPTKKIGLARVALFSNAFLKGCPDACTPSSSSPMWWPAFSSSTSRRLCKARLPQGKPEKLSHLDSTLLHMHSPTDLHHHPVRTDRCANRRDDCLRFAFTIIKASARCSPASLGFSEWGGVYLS